MLEAVKKFILIKGKNQFEHFLSKKKKIRAQNMAQRLNQARPFTILIKKFTVTAVRHEYNNIGRILDKNTNLLIEECFKLTLPSQFGDS